MIPLHTYVDGFREGKLRPGFRVEDKLFVLTSVKPKTTYLTLAGSCCSGHFRSQGKKYVTLASNQEAFRYNNVVGGYLTLDAKRFERVFNVKLTSYLSTQTTHFSSMSKLLCFADVNGFFIIKDGPAYAAASGITIDQLKTQFEVIDGSGTPLAAEWAVVTSWPKSPDEKGKAWGERLQGHSVPLARTALLEELTAIYGAEAATILTDPELVDDKTLPSAVETVVNYLADQTEETTAALVKMFGELPATIEAAPQIDPEAIQQAMIENQQPVAEGQPAEVLAEPEVEAPVQETPAEQPQLEIQPADSLPESASQKERGTLALVNLTIKSGLEAVKDARETAAVANRNLDKAMDRFEETAKKAGLLSEQILSALPAAAIEEAPVPTV